MGYLEVGRVLVDWGGSRGGLVQFVVGGRVLIGSLSVIWSILRNKAVIFLRIVLVERLGVRMLVALLSAWAILIIVRLVMFQFLVT